MITRLLKRVFISALLISGSVYADLDDIQLTVGSATVSEGDAFYTPIVISDLTGLGVISYQFNILYPDTLLQYLGFDQANTLSANGAVVDNSEDNLIQVSAMFIEELEGSGVLLNLGFQAIQPDTATLVPADAVFNTTTITNLISGTVVIQHVYPTPLVTLPHEVGQKGDTLVLSLSCSDVAPWNVISFQTVIHYDPSVLTIDTVSTANSVLSGWTVEWAIQDSQLVIAGMSADPLTDDGVLFNIVADIDTGASTYSELYSTDFLFNTNVIPDIVNGRIDLFGLQHFIIEDQELSHVTTLQPVFTWQSYNTLDGQTEFKLQIGTDEDWIVVEVIDLPWQSDIGTYAYSGDDLVPGGDYYSRMKVRSDTLESSWHELAFHVNEPPSMPVMQSPPDGAMVSAPVLLTVMNSSDSENDTLLYTFSVYGDSILTTLVAVGDSVIETPDSTSFVAPELQENHYYWWTAHATDGYEESPVSDARIFLLNSYNDTPTILGLPDISFPEDSFYTFDLDDYVVDVDDDLDNLTWSVSAIGTGDLLHLWSGLGSGYKLILPLPETQFTSSSGSNEAGYSSGSDDSGFRGSILTGTDAGYERGRDEDTLFISIDDSTHLVTFSATLNYSVADVPYEFTVTDTGNASDSDTIMVTVIPVNDPPVFLSTLPDTSFYEDSALQIPLSTWFNYVEDVDDDDSTLIWSIVTGDHVQATILADTVVLSTDLNWYGLDSLTVFVFDSEFTDTSSLVVNVDPVNDTPVVSDIPDTVILENGTTKVYLSPYVNDPDLPEDHITWSYSGGDSLLVTINNDTAVIGHLPGWTGEDSIIFIATDDSMATDSDLVRVEVIPIPRPTNLIAQSGLAYSVPLIWNEPDYTPSWEPQIEELVYDDGSPANAYTWGNGARMASRMTPPWSCRILEIKFYHGTPGLFRPGIFSWTGSAPGGAYLEFNYTSTSAGWFSIDVSSYNIEVTGDFIVSNGLLNSTVSLGYDPVNNSRAWDYNGASWSSWNETYFIRAVVEELGTGRVAEIGYGAGGDVYSPVRSHSDIDTKVSFPVVERFAGETQSSLITINDGRITGASSRSVRDILSHYNVYRSTVSSGPYSLLVTGIEDTTYEDEDVEPATTYYYVVSAVYSEPPQESGYSNETSATTDFPPVLNPLPDTSFNEDDTLVLDLALWYPYVDDGDTPDEELVWMFSGTNVYGEQFDSTVYLTAEPNWNGTESISVSVTDGQLSDTTTLDITVIPVNDLPSPFSLVSPDEGDTVESLTVPFLWHQSSDPDGEEVSYALHLSGAGADTALSGLVDTTLTFDGVDYLEFDSTYTWYVQAFAGIDTVQSMTQNQFHTPSPGTAPAQVTAYPIGPDAMVKWSMPGPTEPTLVEISYNDGIPTSGFYQNFGQGYGVVFDLSDYQGATLEEIDFNHYGWGFAGPYDYNLLIYDWDNQVELTTINGLTAQNAAAQPVWEEGISLGSLSWAEQVGIFIEPLSGSSDDAYPDISTDSSPPAASGTSFIIDLSSPFDNPYDISINNPEVGDFLIDLWIAVSGSQLGLSSRTGSEQGPAGPTTLSERRMARSNQLFSAQVTKMVNSSQARYGTNTKGQIPQHSTVTRRYGKVLAPPQAFNIYRGSDPSNMSLIASVDPETVEYLDVEAPQDSSYYYGVSAVYDLGESDVIFVGYYHPPLLTIEAARVDIDGDFLPDMLDEIVTISGIVTSPNFGSATDYFIQDESAGINLFEFDLSWDIDMGHELYVTGTIDQYRGRTEIIPTDSTGVYVLSTGNTLPDTQTVTISLIGEQLEGMLIQMDDVWLVDLGQWPDEGSDGNVDITDGLDTLVLRIDKDTNLDGWIPPEGHFTVVGVLDQFTYSDPPNDGYQLRPRFQSDISPTAGVYENIQIPQVFALYQNYPNPFNPTTTLRYDLPEEAHVYLVIYDILGHNVRTLVDQYEEAGYRSVIWDGTNDRGKQVGAGVYLYRVQAGEYTKVRKMVLLK